MRITRISLRNYRVYESCDLDVPPGLVGIYGPNGSGKSYLVESILWALFGRSRTTIADVRTSDVRTDSSAEVEFEHEGHLYAVRRLLTGARATPKASVIRDHQQVSEGVRDSGLYVRRLLGMDDHAFTASVFAEQKEIAAFSDLKPEQRRKLVLDLLGISAVDMARDTARSDARVTATQHERMREMLPDAGDLNRKLEEAKAEAARLVEEARQADEQRQAAVVAEEEAREADQVLADQAVRYEALVAEGRAARGRIERAEQRIAALTGEVDALQTAAGEAEALRPQVAALPGLEERFHKAEAVVIARSEVAALILPPQPPAVDVDGLAAARAEADEAARQLAAIEGERDAVAAHLRRAEEAFRRSENLTGEADCPLCGQALGDAFDKVRLHRHEELQAARHDVDRCEAARKVLTTRAKKASANYREWEKRTGAAQEARLAYERATAQAEDARRRLVAAEAALRPALADGEVEELSEKVRVGRGARDQLSRLEGHLGRLDAARAELARETAEHDEAVARRDDLMRQLEVLGFDPAAKKAAQAACVAARKALERAQENAQTIAVAHAHAAQAVAALEGRLEEARRLREDLEKMEDDSRHRGRVAELLGAFRNSLVSTIGPRLAAQASDLFAELTDREYDQLEVDPQTFEIHIRDAGHSYGMGRFSGSEKDLANLALRVAISEHVRLQSGGEVGLLVLDEVFGSLDADRKARMLLALQRLQGRFRQVLVITHDAEIKEELPHAIEVVKLPGRRATARVVVA